ncbi:MAG TPA: cysteine--tRNA ligase [Patescibacteria group bacterium]|nr:cysteine--tRNA ligase [Patescibacteria group bacterium]
MGLRLYNSLGKKIEEFRSIKDNEVSLYVCGITPDAAIHLGHAFTYLTFDVLIRYLRFLGYRVNYLQNITDIDDDILVRSKKAGYDWKEFGDKWVGVFEKNMDALGWIKPDPYVRATGAIPTIIKIVEGLVDKGFCYNVDGTVYFDVEKFSKYGELSGLSEKEMINLSAERGANPNDPAKRNPLDFIVWQKAKENEPTWDSPWGPGRPGWHIECSSMIYENLGSQIDVHGGGFDLIYPHHESEIAQSESYTGKSPFSRFFMHVVYLKFGGEKMSKSLGNLIMVEKLLEDYTANAIRWLLLSHHYRTSWEYEDNFMKSAQDAADLIDRALSMCEKKDSEINLPQEFVDAMNNDLDTPKALEMIALLANKIIEDKASREEQIEFISSLKLLGFSLN